jgi:hypothetical protein
MKKDVSQTLKLKLSRETLRVLETPRLADVAGALLLKAPMRNKRHAG